MWIISYHFRLKILLSAEVHILVKNSTTLPTKVLDFSEKSRTFFKDSMDFYQKSMDFFKRKLGKFVAHIPDISMKEEACLTSLRTHFFKLKDSFFGNFPHQAVG